MIGTLAYLHERDITISSLNSQIINLQSNVTSLQYQVYELNATVNFQREVSLSPNGTISVDQEAGTYNSWNYSIPYAGMIEVFVNVNDAALNNTYLRVVWNYQDIHYDVETNGGFQNTEFPVLPTSDLEITVGNTIPTGQVTGYIAITYYS